MANYWKEKVLPKIKKVFEKNGGKKAAAAEVIKAFDEAKEGYAKEFEEKKNELEPKVVEIYEASSTEVKGLIKTPKESGLKKQSVGVQKFLDELVKIEFPGSKAVSEASTKFGPAYVSGPVSFVFEKVSTFIVIEEEKKEEPAPAAATTDAETATAAAPAAAAEETSTTTTEVKEKEIEVEGGEKKEETPPPEKTEPPAAPKAEEAAPASEPPKA